MSGVSPRYIDATFAKVQFTGNFQDSYSPAEAKVLIDEVPTADVLPVVHAHWVEQFEGTYLRRAMYCSACKKKSGIGGSKANQMKPYCPNCGAKMDGG